MGSDQIRQQTVVAQVMDAIRELIASGAYSPGDRIPTEKELAEKFGVGRSSIREAVKIFNYLGVLHSRAALGTFVQERSNISAEALSWSLLLGNDELNELIDLRGGVELWALMELVDGIAGRDPSALATLSELSAIVDRMVDSVEHGRREDLVEADFRFHYIIINSSKNHLFAALSKTLRAFLHAEIRTSQDDYESASQICDEHRQLVEAFQAGNPTVALSAYTEHIQNIKDRLRSQATKAGGTK